MRAVLHALAVTLLLLPPAPAQEPHDHDHEHDDPTFGGLLEAPEPEMEPEEILELAPAVRVEGGDAAGLRVEVERAPSEGFPGLRARVRVVNDGDEERRIDAVLVTEETLARPWALPDRCAALVIEGERLDRCEVTPFRVRRESRRVALVALPDRRLAFVAGFPTPPPDVETSVSVEPGRAVTLKLGAAVRYGGRPLAPGESLVTPDLLVQFAPEAWVGLEPFLADAPPGTAETTSDPSMPIVSVPRDDGGLALARSPRGRALDLLEGDGRAHVWWLASDGAPEVELDNRQTEVRTVRLRFADAGLSPVEAVEVVGPDGSLGLHRGGATLVLPPSTTLRVRLEPRSERTPPGPGWELVAVAPPEVGRPVTVERFDPNDPRVAERLAHAFRYGGFVIANHSDDEVLAPLPPALAAALPTEVFPVHARTTRTPRGDEDLFLERAANVEWLLGLPRRPRQERDAGAWLACRAAGFDATPIEGVIADGLPAARGFCVPTSPGLAIVTLGLAPADVDALAETLRARELRVDVLRNIGRAMRTLRSGTPGGLFDELPFERLAPADLAPASGFSAQQWSLQVAADGRAVERRPTADGDLVAEDVLLFTRPMVFALDAPIEPSDRIAVVVRRRASATLDDWTLELDASPIGDVRRRARPFPPGAAGPDGWIDEVFTIGEAELKGRPRVALVLRPVGGVMPLARLAFFRVPAPPGTPLVSLPAGRVRTEGPTRRDLDAGGHALRMAGEAFLDGFGFGAGAALEVDLDGASLSLLARVGVDSAAKDDARAVVRILVDGDEVQTTDVLRAGEPPIPLTVPVAGARLLRLEVEAVDGSEDVLIDLVDARLVAR